MRGNIQKSVLEGAFILAVGVLFATTAFAQVPIAQSKQVSDLTEIVVLDVNPGEVRNVYTVPLGKRVIITDVIISSNIRLGNKQDILRDGKVISRINVPNISDGNYEHSYVTGIEFTENQTLSISNGSDIGEGTSTNWELRGYLTK